MVAQAQPDPSFATMSDESKKGLALSLAMTLKNSLPDGADIILHLVDVAGKDSFMSSSVPPGATASVLMGSLRSIFHLYPEKDDPDHD